MLEKFMSTKSYYDANNYAIKFVCLNSINSAKNEHSKNKKQQ